MQSLKRTSLFELELDSCELSGGIQTTEEQPVLSTPEPSPAPLRGCVLVIKHDLVFAKLALHQLSNLLSKNYT